jgi:hypothetical protein
MKYVGKENAHHSIACIKEKYKLTKDWSGDLYCDINLKWNYIKRTLEISMPGCIKRQQLKYKALLPPDHNIAHTHRCHGNMDLRPKPPSPQIQHDD